MKLSEFDYNLPKKFIAQKPVEPRDHSKLMVLDRTAGKIEHRHFLNIVDHFKKGDVLIVNNSKVMAARLFGKKSTGARVEILLLHKVGENSSRKVSGALKAPDTENDIVSNIWRALVKPAKRLRAGDEVVIGGSGGQEWNNRERDGFGESHLAAFKSRVSEKSVSVILNDPERPRIKCEGVEWGVKDPMVKRNQQRDSSPSCCRAQNDIIPGHSIKMKILKELEEGIRLVQFNEDIVKDLDAIGIVPLPPYIKSDNANIFRERYQTVYSKRLGSAAAPTAGLHFTPELIKNLKKKGVIFKEATLHIGLDTFRPMAVENIEEHKIHKEYCELDEETAEFLTKAKKDGRRIIAVGTTAARVLESVCDQNGKFKPFKGWTGIFIYPGYKFKAIDALITNFHLPKSSLLLLVSSFAGKEFILKSYEEAKKNNYRFFSFGDAMIIV